MLIAWQAMLGLSAGAHLAVALHFFRSALVQNYPAFTLLCILTAMDELAWNPVRPLSAAIWIMLAFRVLATVEARMALPMPRSARRALFMSSLGAAMALWFALEPVTMTRHFVRQWAHASLAAAMIFASMIAWIRPLNISASRHCLLLAIYFSKFTVAQMTMLYWRPLAAAWGTDGMTVWLTTDIASSGINLALCFAWLRLRL